MIRLEHVTKVFPGSTDPAVTDLSLDVPEGEIVVLIGPSGCGKSTTLRMINRLIEPTSGTITVGGTDVTSMDPSELRRGIGYVIQQIGLFPHRTIAQNVATVPKLLGWDRGRTAARVDELLDLVGLDPELAGRYPHALSGGQQQRVGVARALAADPPVLLMDEPFGAVDPLVRGRLQGELLELQQRLHKTIVLVTHDLDEAVHLADRMAILAVGGVLEAYGPPAEILARPPTPFAESFLGADRGLRRLSLGRVRDLPLGRGPVVSPGTSPEEAKDVMAEYGVDWVAVLDARRLLGWVGVAGLDDVATVGDAVVAPFRAWVRPDDTLRSALDALVTSETNVAVVFDDADEYLGMLDIARLSEHVQ